MVPVLEKGGLATDGCSRNVRVVNSMIQAAILGDDVCGLYLLALAAPKTHHRASNYQLRASRNLGKIGTASLFSGFPPR